MDGTPDRLLLVRKADNNIGNGESNCESLWIVPLLLWIGYCDTVGE